MILWRVHVLRIVASLGVLVVCVQLLATAGVAQEPNPTVTPDPTVTPPATPAPGPALELVVIAPTIPLTVGQTIVLSATVANVSDGPLSSVGLALPYHPDLYYLAAGGLTQGGVGNATLDLGEMAAGASSLVTATAVISGVSPLTVMDLSFAVTAAESDPITATTALTVTPPLPETAVVPIEGGAVALADSHVVMEFGTGWNDQPADLSFQVVEQHQLELGQAGVLLHFEAEALVGGQQVLTFTAPVTVTLSISDWVNLEQLETSRLYLRTRENETDPWTDVPFTFDAAAGVAQFSAPHFSGYQLGSEAQPWKLTYNPPGTSAFSGAASYSYPIPVPPGVGGLAPSLALSYGSRGVDGMVFPVMSTGFGAGWALPQAEIVNGNAARMYSPLCGGVGCPGFDNWRLTLVLNGATYHLQADELENGRHGVYVALGDPSLRIEYVDDLGAPNVTGEYWEVRTADGTLYRFGYNEWAEQVVGPVSAFHNVAQPRSDSMSVASWKLDSVEDVYGHRVEYFYKSKCGQPTTGATCRRTDTDTHVVESSWPGDNNPGDLQLNRKFRTEVDVALAEIHYNFVGTAADTLIILDHEFKNDSAMRDERFVSVGYYRPNEIIVKQSGNVVSGYTVTYSEDNHNVPSQGYHTYFWWPTQLQAFGSNYVQGSGTAVGTGTALPAQTFYYDTSATGCGLNLSNNNVCVKLLTRVDNGYGGVTKLVYSPIGGKSFHVTDVYTWDGVKSIYGSNNNTAGSRTTYTYVGACYDDTGTPTIGCRGPGLERSFALVGFDNTTTEVKRWDGSNWVAVSKQFQKFNVALYWLNGKVEQATVYKASSSTKLSERIENWSWDGTDYFAKLNEATNTLYDPTNNSQYTGVKEQYTYDPLLQGGRQWGRPTRVETLAVADENTLGTRYRCTDTNYQDNDLSTVWVQVPYQQTLYDCTTTPWVLKQATLYLYDGQADPDNQTISRGQLLWTLAVDVPAGTPVGTWNAVATRHQYYGGGGVKEGLLWRTTTYDAYAGVPYTTSGWGSVATPADATWRNRASRDYTVNGTVVAWQEQEGNNGLTTQHTDITYATPFAWLPAVITDTNNLVTQYGYDLFGRLTKVARPGDTLTSPTIKYGYWDDPGGSAVFITPLLIHTEYKNNLQSAIRYFYDGLGRLVQEQAAGAEIAGQPLTRDVLVTYGYDALSRQDCQTVAYDTAAYTWNPAISPYQNDTCTTKDHTTTTYDDAGRVWQVTGPDSQTITTTYEVPGGWTGSVGRGAWQQKVVNSNDDVTLHTYDAYGRLDWVGQKDDGGWCNALQVTTYDYDVLDHLKTVTRGGYVCGTGYTPGSVFTQMTYDALGRKLDMTDPDMGRWDYSYDVAGNLVSQDDALDKVVQFVTDAYNRPLGKSLPLAASTAFVLNRYDTGTNGLGRLASVDTYAPTFSDDFNRSTLGSNWSSSGSVSMTGTEVYGYKNGPNAIVWRPLFNLTAGDGARFDFRVNNISGLSDEIELISNGGTYQVELLVDGGNLKARAKDTNGFTSSAILMSAQNTVQYSGLLAIGDNGWVTVQVWEKNNPGKAAQWTYSLVAGASTQLYGFQMTVKAGDGYLDNYEELDRTSGSAYIYDDHGLVTQETRRIGSSTYDAGYSYDDLDRPTSLTFPYPGGEVITTGYNNQGLPESLTGTNPTTTFVSNVTYNARGQMSLLDRPSPVPDTTYTYHPALDITGGGLGDANFRLASMTAGSLLNFSYQYDKVGNVTQIEDRTMPDIWGNPQVQTFAYDHLGRLLTAAATGGNGNGLYNHSYTYGTANQQQLGNLTQRTESGTIYSYVYSVSQRHAVTQLWQGLNQIGTYGYDANGNMTTRNDNEGNFTQVFDVENRLVSVNNNVAEEVTTFTYDASGQRVKTVEPNGTVIHYPFPFHEVENPGQPSEIKRTTYALGGQIIALRVTGGTSPGLYYVYTDHLGSTSRLSNSSGILVSGSDARYLPFGKYRVTPTAGLTDRGFTGHLHNDPLGLVYMNARYYVPYINRFLSADTIVPDPKNPQTFNRYAYALNNPIRYTDPTGHIVCEDSNLSGSCTPESGSSVDYETLYGPSIWLPAGYEWVLLTPGGDGQISFYTLTSVDEPGASTPEDLSDESHYRLQGSVILNDQLWNYIVTDADSGEGYWQENTWSSSCSPAFASATQCIVPLEYMSPEQPVTGAVNTGSPIPMGRDRLAYVQVENGSYPFDGDGLLINTRDECPGCANSQIDILTVAYDDRGAPRYPSYNISSISDRVYIWAALPSIRVSPMYAGMIE
ncbi:MAG: RHS repeat-associated core domain-containing protein [Chloroflexota bacterium]